MAGRSRCPQALGWSLAGRVVTEVNATISKLGSMPGRRGNLHVATWLVDSDDYESILEPVVDYRCPDPSTADADDPEASGCTQKGEGAGYNWSLLGDTTVGSKLVIRIAEGDVDPLQVRRVADRDGEPDLESLRVRGRALSAAPTRGPTSGGSPSARPRCGSTPARCDRTPSTTPAEPRILGDRTGWVARTYVTT